MVYLKKRDYPIPIPLYAQAAVCILNIVFCFVLFMFSLYFVEDFLPSISSYYLSVILGITFGLFSFIIILIY